MIDLKIKKLHPKAVIPSYAKPGDAGLDLTATSKEYVEMDQVIYGTGLAFEIPEGFVGLIFPRSSIKNYDLVLSNSVGVLDSGFRGEVKFVFKLTQVDAVKYVETGGHNVYSVGERIGQLIVIHYPKMNIIEATELSETERGNGGFGSTGM